MMMMIIKYSTVKATNFDHLMPPRITIAAHQSIEEVFGFNLSHWSTQLSRYSRHTSVDGIMVGSVGAKNSLPGPNILSEIEINGSAIQAPSTPAIYRLKSGSRAFQRGLIYYMSTNTH